eukprot:GDKJ01020485.1.p1 GENE.GDKJ01020485.1~~GDKJ01020485.1.p1  ORF type:complete len:1153 (+),score=276.59 GDKJ01020485.1:2-3460(+)
MIFLYTYDRRMSDHGHGKLVLGLCCGLLAALFASMGDNITRASHFKELLRPQELRRPNHKRPLFLFGNFCIIVINPSLSIITTSLINQSLSAPLGATHNIFNVFLAYLLLGEAITLRSLLGTLSIFAGAIAIIFGSDSSTTGSPPLEIVIDRMGSVSGVLFLSMLGGGAILLFCISKFNRTDPKENVLMFAAYAFVPGFLGGLMNTTLKIFWAAMDFSPVWTSIIAPVGVSMAVMLFISLNRGLRSLPTSRFVPVYSSTLMISASLGGMALMDEKIQVLWIYLLGFFFIMVGVLTLSVMHESVSEQEDISISECNQLPLLTEHNDMLLDQETVDISIQQQQQQRLCSSQLLSKSDEASSCLLLHRSRTLCTSGDCLSPPVPLTSVTASCDPSLELHSHVVPAHLNIASHRAHQLSQPNNNNSRFFTPPPLYLAASSHSNNHPVTPGGSQRPHLTRTAVGFRSSFDPDPENLKRLDDFTHRIGFFFLRGRHQQSSINQNVALSHHRNASLSRRQVDYNVNNINNPPLHRGLNALRHSEVHVVIDNDTSPTTTRRKMNNTRLLILPDSTATGAIPSTAVNLQHRMNDSVSKISDDDDSVIEGSICSSLIHNDVNYEKPTESRTNKAQMSDQKKKVAAANTSRESPFAHLIFNYHTNTLTPLTRSHRKRMSSLKNVLMETERSNNSLSKNTPSQLDAACESPPLASPPVSTVSSIHTPLCFLDSKSNKKLQKISPNLKDQHPNDVTCQCEQVSHGVSRLPSESSVSSSQAAPISSKWGVEAEKGWLAEHLRDANQSSSSPHSSQRQPATCSTQAFASPPSFNVATTKNDNASPNVLGQPPHDSYHANASSRSSVKFAVECPSVLFSSLPSPVFHHNRETTTVLPLLLQRDDGHYSSSSASPVHSARQQIEVTPTNTSFCGSSLMDYPYHQSVINMASPSNPVLTFNQNCGGRPSGVSVVNLGYNSAKSGSLREGGSFFVHHLIHHQNHQTNKDNLPQSISDNVNYPVLQGRRSLHQVPSRLADSDDDHDDRDENRNATRRNDDEVLRGLREFSKFLVGNKTSPSNHESHHLDQNEKKTFVREQSTTSVVVESSNSDDNTIRNSEVQPITNRFAFVKDSSSLDGLNVSSQGDILSCVSSGILMTSSLDVVLQFKFG